MRRTLTLAAALVLVLSATVAIGQVTRPDGSFSPTRTDVFTLDGPRTLNSAASTDFASIVNTRRTATTWVGYLVPSRGRMTVTFNGNFTGDPVRLRVVDDGATLYPSETTFAPQANGGSFSYTFVARGSRRAGCHYIDPQWRTSPAGGTVTITDMVVTITYTRDTTIGKDPLPCPA